MGNLVEKIVNYLLKRGAIAFSPIDESFFIYKRLDKKIHLTEEIIKLNYLNESPYDEASTAITSVVNKEDLYLWFHKNKKVRHLPEALLLYRKVELKDRDIIVIVEDKIDKVIVIKESTLVSSFSKKNIKEHDILLMKDEHSLENVKILKRYEYDGFLKESYKSLTIKDLFYILNIQLDIKTILSKALVWSALPLLVSSILITLALGVYNFLMEKDKALLFSKYKVQQKVNMKIKDSIESNENENLAFKNLSNEFRYIDKSVVISNVVEVTKDMNMTLAYIKVYNNQVDFNIKTKNQFDIPHFIEKLFKSNYLVDIKNLSSRNLQDKRVEVRMSAKLRMR